MVTATKYGNLLKAQVERSKSRQKVVVMFAATLPGDGSQVSVDWWLRNMNEALRGGGVDIELEFADVDAPSKLVSDGESDPIKLTAMKRRMEEMQLYIDDLEAHIDEKAEEKAKKILGRAVTDLTDEETALRAVDNNGVYVDAEGFKWVDIEAEAKRIGQNYINLWRAVKGITKSSIQSMVVGTTNAGGDRILVKQGSFVQAKKGRQKHG